jgi:hypothetical protein
MQITPGGYSVIYLAISYLIDGDYAMMRFLKTHILLLFCIAKLKVV